MKQLTGTQADIIQVQADLTATIDGAAISGEETPVPQDKAASIKPSVLRTTAPGGSQPRGIRGQHQTVKAPLAALSQGIQRRLKSSHLPTNSG